MAVGVLGLAGCGGSGGSGDSVREDSGKATGAATGGDGGSAGPSAVAAGPATVEQLAEAVGCTAQIRMTVEDYRQGVCKKGGTGYTLITFTTEKNKRDWVDYAQMYGGTYLIGTRWVIGTDDEKNVKGAQGKLGGSVEEGQGYDSSGTGDGSGVANSG